MITHTDTRAPIHSLTVRGATGTGLSGFVRLPRSVSDRAADRFAVGALAAVLSPLIVSLVLGATVRGDSCDSHHMYSQARGIL